MISMISNQREFYAKVQERSYAYQGVPYHSPYRDLLNKIVIRLSSDPLY